MNKSSPLRRITQQNGATREMTLLCPIYKAATRGTELMRHHLMTEHLMGRLRAQFLTDKLVSWKQGELDPAILYKVFRNL